MKLIYIYAEINDAEMLSTISKESKKYWGYSDALIKFWKEDLEVTPEYISENKVVKVFDQEILIGFYAIKVADEVAEIDHLWLRPECIRKNYGKKIFKNALKSLAEDGFEKVSLVAEPNAKGFYEKMGGKVAGSFQSKIKDRVLDIYEFRTETATNR